MSEEAAKLFRQIINLSQRTYLSFFSKIEKSRRDISYDETWFFFHALQWSCCCWRERPPLLQPRNQQLVHAVICDGRGLNVSDLKCLLDKIKTRNFSLFQAPWWLPDWRWWSGCCCCSPACSWAQPKRGNPPKRGRRANRLSAHRKCTTPHVIRQRYSHDNSSVPHIAHTALCITYTALSDNTTDAERQWRQRGERSSSVAFN